MYLVNIILAEKRLGHPLTVEVSGLSESNHVNYVSHVNSVSILCCTGEGVLSFQNLCLILLQNDHAIKYVQINNVS